MNSIKKVSKVFLVCLLSMGAFVFSNSNLQAEENQITGIKAKAKSTSGREAKFAIDGDKSTYYMTPASTSMDDHYRNIDLTLDGVYNISKIKIYNNEGSYNNYQVYASKTGAAFDKIAYKSDSNLATSEGDEYIISDVEASKLRINLSYNSKVMEGNLAEIEVYGTRVGDAEAFSDTINVSDFDETQWASEYAKVQQNDDYATQKTITEMSDLVGRVIGDKWKDSFIFEMRDANAEGNDVFEIEAGPNGKIIIRGNNGISMASGFNHYLRFYCKVDYNPVFASNLAMPEVLPVLEEKIVKETEYDIRYALNFCTYSYTMAFWDWDDYEAFLDWAAMSGINMVLDIVGQEEVIRRTLKEYGYTDTEVKEYISGPGYFAWYYMQNMSSYGGPLPNNWFDQRVELGRKMHDRMQTYGIKPVLSGFSGMVPRNFSEKFPDATIVSQGGWCGYERPDMLRTYIDGDGKDYFSEMADVFYKAQRDVYGDITNTYAVDPFHEGGQIGNMNVTKVYETVQKKMIENDSDAIWLIQQWSGSMNDAKLQGLKVKDQALVLDLFSEINPSSAVMERNDIPWVWNMLHNFGGRMGLDANPEKLSQNIPEAYQNSKHMKGIGMTPEAIENSPMAYELLWDMTWTKDPIDFREWSANYAERTYGGTNDEIKEAWDILLNTGYNRKDSYYQGAPESVINTRPTTNFTSASSWGHSTINYDKKELEKAVVLLANNYDEFKDSPAFIYDLADVTRQLISNSAQEYHIAMVNAYQAGNLAEFEVLSQKFLDMILLQDNVLSTTDDFLVGNWIDGSRTMLEGADDWTNDLFEFNARDLITTWGGKKNANGGGLRDYSNRQWAGVTKDYYYPRWNKWIGDVKDAMKNGKSIASTDWFMFEWEWANKKSDEGFSYSTSASGLNLKDLALEAHGKYALGNLEELVGSVEEKQNIALGKDVTSSIATDPTKPLANLTDGNKETTWVATSNANEFMLSVDLVEESSIDGIEIALKQIAGGFPYSYKVEVYRDGTWTKVAEDNAGEITSQTLIDYRGIGSQVRFTFKTADTTILPEVAELLVFGKAGDKVNYTNVALGKTVMTPDGATNKVTDDNTGTLWVRGNGTYPSLITLDLEVEEYVDVLELYFEKPGLRYQYDVVIEDGDGTKTVVQDKLENLDDLAGMYKIPIHANVQKVYLNLKARAPGGEFYLAWPAVAEIKLLREKEVEFSNQNISNGKPGYVTNENGTTNSTKLTNGSLTDLENVGSDIFPSTFTVDLGSETFIEDVNIHFEKAGLRFKFKVEVVDDNGLKTVIMDKTDNLEDLAVSYLIPAKTRGSRVNVVIEARAPGGSFYLASPAMSEIEVFAKPTNVVSDANVESNIGLTEAEITALVDGDSSTFVEFDLEGEKEIVFNFDKPIDVYAFELMKESAGALQFKVAGMLDNGSRSTWTMLKDESNNLTDTKKHVGEFSPVLVNKIKLTIMSKQAKITGFNVYQSDATVELASYISSIKTKLSKLTIGEFAGNYSPEAKAVLDGQIKTAEDKAKTQLNSHEVSDEIQVLKQAYAQFLKSYVSIDRTSLLSELTEVEALLKTDALKNNQDLKDAYALAKTVYTTNKVTQVELNASKQSLNTAKEAALATLGGDELFKAQLAVAKELVNNAVVGENAGNVSQQTLDTLKAAITQAEADIQSALTSEEITSVTNALTDAITAFNTNKVVIDKAELLEAIALADNLIEKDYTKESWASIKDALAAAKTALAANASQTEINNAKTTLLNAVDAKVLLDRSQLSSIISEVLNYSEHAYTKTTWAAMQTVLTEAVNMNGEISLGQSEVNAMYTKLEGARDQLVALDRTKLQELVSKVQSLDGLDYTPSTWSNMLSWYNAASTLVGQTSLDQAELDVMLTKLQDAYNALELADTSDKLAELRNAVENAKKYKTPEKYTLASYTEFIKAFEYAESLLNARALPTNSEINKAITNLNTSILNLEKVSNNAKPGGANESAGSTSTGDNTNTDMLFATMLMGGITFLFMVKKRKKN